MTNTVRTITVLGAGALGRHIASLAAGAGYRTILEDITGQVTDAALEEIRRTCGSDVVARIEPERALESAAAGADLVIETVPDDLETKTEVYTLLDRSSPPHCIFASTTSLISVSEIASYTYRPSKVVGMTFTMGSGRLELRIGPETSEGTIAAAEQVGRRLGKQVIRMKETLVNQYGTRECQSRES